MDLIFDISNLDTKKEEFSSAKKDVLKFLKIIGVDTRFISYTPNKIYINNLRFSKFSRKREETFKKQYSEIDIVRSSLFQKICSKSSKLLALEIKPNSKILLPEDNFLIELLLEPYTRKYGVKLDNQHFVILKSDEDADDLEKNWDKYADIKKIFISREVLLTGKQEELFSRVDTYIVPDCFYGEELREVGELW